MIIYNQLSGFHILPDGCAFDEYNFNTKYWNKNCGLPPGLCDMFKYIESSIEYKVNWVCVYQDPDYPNKKFWCLVPERPNKRWIEVHEDMYNNEQNVISRLFESFM